MLALYHAIARRLHKIILMVWLAFWASLAFTVCVFFFEQTIVASEQELAVALIPLWFLTMIGVEQYFLHLPDFSQTGLGFFKRLWLKVRWAFSMGVALGFSGVTLAVVYLTFKAIGFVLG